MNLIANTGIQLFTFPLEINSNDNFKMFFHEWFDTDEEQLKLEIAHSFSDDVWVKKYDLTLLGYVNSKDGKVSESWEDTIKDDFDSEKMRIIKIETNSPEDSGCFNVTTTKVKWDNFTNVWLPFPYFLINNNRSEFGPTNWCRFKLIPTDSVGNTRRFDLLVAFDTRTQFVDEGFENEDLYETPVFTNNYDKPKDYALCNNEYKLVDYCSESFNCEWVDEYILHVFHGVRSINELKVSKPKLSYLAQYVYILRYIQQQNLLPQITLFSNRNVAYGDVDLVVDIGNSRTCAVLFDDGDFTKTSPLELQNFLNPISNGKLNKYTDSFDMRMAFRRAEFGAEIGRIGSRQFTYPSLVRLGKEASQLIHLATNMNTGVERTSTFSSPKRFLWDNKPHQHEWEYVKLEGEEYTPFYLEGISEQLNIDGSLKIDGQGGQLMRYSRKTLMTLAFVEILAQANMQINSYEQRNHWGEENKPRKIKRIITTCPTAMSKVEQVALRRCAEDAAIILNRFFENSYREDVEERAVREKINVIPSVRNITSKYEKNEWIYDEASCAQFVFLYAEIGKRYLNNVKEYFDFYGKIRTDIGDYSKKSLTIGSVDIGAGTTDIMISAYNYDDSGQCVLTPVPLFWESFYKAGDDLLKELVHQLVIEGQYSPIEKELRRLGKNNDEIVELNNDFFGGDNGMSIPNRRLRSDFNLQVSVPIASHYLELLKQHGIESKILSFVDIFGENLPTQRLLSHFKSHFGFDFEKLQWNYEKQIVSAIVEKTFDTLIGKISSLFSYYKCDIVLLSGRPMSLKPLTDLFLKYYAISPNRLKTMNNYRVGRWYPEDKRYKFLDGNGYFINPKSIITTGAMIGNYAYERGALDGFSLNLKELIEKMTPTTEYFGKLNEANLEFTETIISPEGNNATIEVMLSQDKPVRFSTRQLDSSSYPSRPFYTLDFNIERIEDRVKGRLDDENDVNAVYNGVQNEIDKIIRNCPLKVTLHRNYYEDKELLEIDSISTSQGDDLNKTFFSLQIQSMSEVDNFWLDSGIFILKTDTSK